MLNLNWKGTGWYIRSFRVAQGWSDVWKKDCVGSRRGEEVCSLQNASRGTGGAHSYYICTFTFRCNKAGRTKTRSAHCSPNPTVLRGTFPRARLHLVLHHLLLPSALLKPASICDLPIPPLLPSWDTELPPVKRARLTEEWSSDPLFTRNGRSADQADSALLSVSTTPI